MAEQVGLQPDPQRPRAYGRDEHIGAHDYRPQERSRTQHPVAWLPGNHDAWLIVASAAGEPRNPAWYYSITNIAANPDKVWIETAGRTIPVPADQFHGEEREDVWQQ